MDRPPPGRPNPSWNLDYNLLAVVAREQKLFDKTNPRLTRGRVSRYSEQLFSEKAMDPHSLLPRACLNETQLQQFHDRSLDLERTVLFSQQSLPLSRVAQQLDRHRMQQQQQQQHEADCDNAVRAHKFCNLDTAQLLLDPEVRAVFELLNTVK